MTRAEAGLPERHHPDWPAIVREHGAMAYDAAYRVLGHAADAEDALQEALADALRIAADPQPAVANWGGLLRRLATCRALDLARSRRRPGPELTDAIPAADAASPLQASIGRELAERLRHALATLPPRQAEVFALHHLAGLSNAEVAEALAMTANAVGVTLHKARSALRQRFSAEAPAEPPGEQP